MHDAMPHVGSEQAQQAESTFDFFVLPPELRLKVYHYTMCDFSLEFAMDRSCPPRPPVLSTCKLIRSEACNAYGTRLFEITAEHYAQAEIATAAIIQKLLTICITFITKMNMPVDNELNELRASIRTHSEKLQDVVTLVKQERDRVKSHLSDRMLQKLERLDAVEVTTEKLEKVEDEASE